MEYFVNLPGTHFARPAEWAAAAEAQGWHGVCASDHILVGTNPYPHVFATAAALATATERVLVTTSFANNLFRSPVEFAQAALTLQLISNGRFEAGLGAGWASHEMQAMGMNYPAPATRVSMYIEALTIVRALLADGQCQFEGDHYRVDVSGDYRLGPLPEHTPPLVASAGGPRNIRESTPLVDRMEIKASARSTRGGALDFAAVATVTEEEVKRNVARVKEVDPDMPIGIFLLVGAGDSPEVQGLRVQFGNGFLGQFVGHEEEVAGALQRLTELGIERVQLTELIPGSQHKLASHLCG